VDLPVLLVLLLEHVTRPAPLLLFAPRGVEQQRRLVLRGAMDDDMANILLVRCEAEV
jgi:hypothetical protein